MYKEKMELRKQGALLIDGNSLFFKAFYGTYARLLEGKERAFKTNEPINALRTFSYMILNLVKKFDCEYTIVAFDKGSNTFRHDFDFYKGNRKKQPDELFQQFPLVKEFLRHMGITTLEMDELEADDIIGIYSNIASQQNFDVNVITTDRDLLQLVDENTKVFLYKGGKEGLKEYNMSNFVELNQVQPHQIPDLKALMGDSSDNIKGVSGIGPKTAIKIINDFLTIENILDSVNENSHKNILKIHDERENVLIYKKLTQIVRDPLFVDGYEFKIEQIKRTEIKKNDLITYLNQKSVFNVAKKIDKDF